MACVHVNVGVCRHKKQSAGRTMLAWWRWMARSWCRIQRVLNAGFVTYNFSQEREFYCVNVFTVSAGKNTKSMNDGLVHNWLRVVNG